ncbi:MAG: pyridoxal-dependent decarboxylase [Deltaproteobacteria bacterium RBG_13_60_28]|nr:MAG: pyridoxal-dependent decarboxylase [Deltaproteobacteria bacterium RBG_13_60_28]
MTRIERKEAPPYRRLLQELQTCFPVPVSNPVMDGYFVHTVSRFLDRVDDLKSAAPLLGQSRQAHYRDNLGERFPQESATVEEITRLLVEYCQGMTIWAHPNAQVNVIPPTTIPSITAFVAAAIYNPNIIWDEYSARFAEAEMQTVSMLSDLIGYDPQRSGGVFTFSGTGTNFYGCRLGLEKVLGGRAMEEGIREDVKIVSSSASHYSRLNVSGWLGVGMKNLVTIPTTAHNDMSLPHLEDYLRRAFAAGEKVGVIIATMGTTDAFGLDDLGAIVRLRDQLAREYGLPVPPHIHADAVIGWVWSVFRDYDFADNPLGFGARTLKALQDSLRRLGDLAQADSLGIDFHKTGYTPYVSSLFLVKDRQDLSLLSRHPEEMPYLYQFGSYHPGIYTLECSRSGAGALAAFANIRLLGKQGYRVLIGHAVEMAEMLRERLEAHPFIQVVNDGNFGPVTLFRVYPPGVEGEAAFRREVKDPAYRKELEAHNTYNRRVFQLIHDRAMRGKGVLLSWTDAYRHANYGSETGPPIAALKSFILSPWTDLTAVETVARQVAEVRAQMESER